MWGAWGGTRVFAHIDPDPQEAPAGSVQSVGFTVEHGCDGSATVQLDMRLPEGVTDAVPEPPAGWTGGVDGRVVTFSGGPLPDDVEGTFRVRMTLPVTPGATISFPFVQRCEQGETHWIQLGANANLGLFLERGGWQASADQLTLWDGVEHRTGTTCPNGQPARVRWWVDDIEQHGDPSTYTPRDGQVIVLGFDTEPTPPGPPPQMDALFLPTLAAAT